jgi:hypothetical protein
VSDSNQVNKTQDRRSNKHPLLDSLQPIDAFIQGFGENRAHIVNEMVGFWRNSSDTINVINPINLFNHLLDVRVQKGLIDPARGKELKKIFADSYDAEQTTGYAPKHRVLLIDELSKLYVTETRSPLYVLKADIGNLGGLNNALIQVFGGNIAQGRSATDKIFGVMATILKEEFAQIADVMPVRSGGDELEITFKPHADVTADRIHQAQQKVHERIREFINEAGLDNIVHPKYIDAPSRRGVNIGLSVVEIKSDVSKELQNQLAEVLIARSKIEQQIANANRERSIDPSIPTKSTIEAVLDKYREYIPRNSRSSQNNEIAQSSNLGYERGSTPDEYRQMAIARRVREASSAPTLSSAEYALISGVTALTNQKDPVTNMPLFTEVREIFRHFMLFHGEKVGAKLLHFDFNNMAGGNKIFEGVGDAMGTAFSDILRDAMRKTKLEQYIPYITTQGGGKFALLVPGDTTDEVINTLVENAHESKAEFSRKPLVFTDEQRRIIRDNIKTNMEIHDIYQRANMPPPNPDSMRMDDIVHPKSFCTGVRMLFGGAVAISTNWVGEPMPSLYEQIKVLETNVFHQQKTDDSKNGITTNGGIDVHGTTPKQSGNIGEPHPGRTAAAIGAKGKGVAGFDGKPDNAKLPIAQDNSPAIIPENTGIADSVRMGSLAAQPLAKINGING